MQGDRGAYLSNGQRQVPEGIKDCRTVTTISTRQGALQLPDKEIWGETDMRCLNTVSPFSPLPPQTFGCWALDSRRGPRENGLLMLCSGKALSREGRHRPPCPHLPPIRLSSRSRYFLHIWRPFSSSLGPRERGRQLGQSSNHDKFKGLGI